MMLELGAHAIHIRTSELPGKPNTPVMSQLATPTVHALNLGTVSWLLKVFSTTAHPMMTTVPDGHMATE